MDLIVASFIGMSRCLSSDYDNLNLDSSISTLYNTYILTFCVLYHDRILNDKKSCITQLIFRCENSEDTRKFYEDFLGLPLVHPFFINETEKEIKNSRHQFFIHFIQDFFPSFFLLKLPIKALILLNNMILIYI